ncbi:MAG: extracellular solute-binding protein [Bacteroidota bacterium]
MRLLLPLLALVLLLPACGSGTDDGVTTVRIWHLKDAEERVVLEEAAKRYSEANPDVNVEVLYKDTEELRNHYVFGAIGGKGPDMIYGPADNVGLYALTETAMALQDRVDPAFVERFEEDGLLFWGDSLLLVADQLGSHLTFVYNKTLMPEPPATLDELVAMAPELTVDADGDGRPEQYALTWNYTEPFFLVPFLSGFGGWMLDENGRPTLDTPEMVNAIQFVLDLRDEHQVIPRESDYNIAETLFKEGRAAAVINGPWSWGGYAEAGVDFGMARIPYNTETGIWPAPIVSARGYSVNAAVTDEKLPYVLDVLDYLTGEEVQRQMVRDLFAIPTLKTVRRDTVLMQSNEFVQQSLSQAEVSKSMPTEPQLRQIWDGMRGPYQLVMNGNVSAEEGARLMQKQAEELIADTFDS